ncbi:hypothetical protein HMPREF1861_02350 [Corynebacterium kroppenstedtii]|nr:hypothetical protein HMPREF1861_02350 [Corynebacterium kroppenstedtii]
MTENRPYIPAVFPEVEQSGLFPRSFRLERLRMPALPRDHTRSHYTTHMRT